jgi:hypothetical protein
MRIPGIAFYQAASSNYSRGREAQAIKYITVHHSAGWEATLRYLWADPNRNGSSHFWVGNLAGQIEQYVDTDDTAWTNGNWRSNLQSLTIETRGDWRNGYYSQSTLDNLGKLILELRKRWPNAVLEFHKDVSDKITLCPADLKDKGYARVVWDAVTGQLNPPPAPAPKITYEKITPKRVQLKYAANLWDFNFTAWANAKSVKVFGAGEVIDVVAIATNQLGGKYYMTAYSYNNGAVRATNGFNVADVKDYVPAVTQPPTVEEKWEPFANPRKMRLLYDNRVTDLDKKALAGDVIPAGTDIDLVDKKTIREGQNTRVYARSKWSKDNSKNWGIPLDQFGEVPTPPAVPEPPREPVPEPPIDTDPTTPGQGDVEKRLSALEKIVQGIVDFLKGLFTGFKG